jgi:NAD(P)-dependent dehydrogenase (short-subunit alcohol dehydrogenase family)
MPVRFENASITGQVVLITAGAAGIGRAIAERFLSHQCRVHVCDIDQQVLQEFLADNPAASGSLADVADANQVDAMFEDIKARYGQLDILVNNAGVAGPVARLEEISKEDWDRTIAVDLNGQFYVTRRAVPMMKSAGSGSIINISSTAALFGCPMRAPYSASKWAVIGLTKTLAMELGPWGVRVNAICPGSVEGPRIDKVIEDDARRRGVASEEIRELYQRQTSLRRFVSADEVANMAVFLASDLCGAISGQAMSVDGHTETLSHVMD